jgi:hypothetical protein
VGFLKRLFGGSATQLNTVATFFPEARDDAVVQVVGEHYRQGNLADARPPRPSDLPPGVPPPPPGHYKAMLYREPSNQYDANAVMVMLWAGGNWTICGYIARSDAAEYRLVFDHLQRILLEKGDPDVAAICCDAALISEGAERGVVLHLGTPGECAASLVTADLIPRKDHPWVGQVIAFTGQGVTTIHGVPIDRYAQSMLGRWAGCDVLPRVTKKTNLLVVANPSEATANVQKAKEYGIANVSEPDFLVGIGLPVEAIAKDSNRWARA